MMGSNEDPVFDLNRNAQMLRKLQAAKNLRRSTVIRREKKRA